MRSIAVGILLLLLSPMSWYTVMLIQDKRYQRTIACEFLEEARSRIGVDKRLDAKLMLHKQGLYCFEKGN